MKRLSLLPMLALLALVMAVAVWTGRAPRQARSQFTMVRDGGVLIPGKVTVATVAVDPEGRTVFRFDVPDDAIFAEIQTRKSPIDLDFYLTYDGRVDDLSEADFAAGGDEYNETLRITAWDDLALQPGTYFLDVVPAFRQVPRVRGRRVEGAVEFEMGVELIRAAPTKLSLGQIHRSTISREGGFAATFEIDVDNDLDRLRLDIFDAETSLEMFVSREGPVAHDGNSLVRLDGIESRKQTLFDGQSDPPLEAGTYFISIVDRYQSESRFEFSLIATRSDQPPAELLVIPPFEHVEDPWRTAMMATVELVTTAGGGSGVVISPQGLILTNYHVVEEPGGGLPTENGVIIAIAIDPKRPPVDLFRGTVVRSDKARDLALIKVTAGYYLQPLPPDNPFPCIPLRPGPPPLIGDGLTVIGYPWIGGTTGRVTLTVAKGVVSGFEYHERIAMLKTDADFHPGHSGGPVLDDKFQLVGIASETIEEEMAAGKIGFVRPIESLPDEWRSLLTEVRE